GRGTASVRNHGGSRDAKSAFDACSPNWSRCCKVSKKKVQSPLPTMAASVQHGPEEKPKMRPERWQTEPGRLALMLAVGAALGAAAHAQAADTATPIQHLVVIYQENVSFDHYFATYPRAANPPGEPAFHARTGTPSVNGLTAAMLTNNPNAAQPFRLDRSRAATCDQDHNYKAEQQGYNAGLVNKAVESMGTGAASRSGNTPCSPTDVMGYFDGNTVTALWNYAQYFAMNDNHFGTTFGPSTPGALNLVSGQTHGATPSCALVASGCTATSD